MKNTIETTTIENLSHDGRGIAHVQGKTIFLRGGLSDESVRFQYTQKKARFDEGQVVEVIQPSPHRVTPRCPHFGICGGCLLQHLSPEQQLLHKQKTFLELLQHQAGLVPQNLLPAIVADVWGYRRKARLSVKYVYKKEKLLVGFREKNSHFVADITRCEILDPAIGTKINLLADLLQQLTIRDQIPQLEIAIGDEGPAIILRHLVPLPAGDLQLLQTFFQQEKIRLYLQPKGLESIHLCVPDSEDPLLHYSLPEYNLRLQFHPAQFVQVNAGINQKMLAAALALLDLQPTDKVLDLFCGIGNFSLPMARFCAQVIGIEGDRSAVEQAQKNATLNGITNAEFYTTDLTQAPALNQNVNKVLLDPPRTGAKEILPAIIALKPTHVIYISCNPATFARDAKYLADSGYTLKAAGIMDMFPHTAHVETLSLFVKNL